jgi:hypothetical protein
MDTVKLNDMIDYLSQLLGTDGDTPCEFPPDDVITDIEFTVEELAWILNQAHEKHLEMTNELL